MLAAPRRSELLPNPSGVSQIPVDGNTRLMLVSQELGIYSATSYSWEAHETETVWHLVNLTNGRISTLYNGSEISEIAWVGPNDTSILYINGTNEEDNGGVSLYAGDVTAIEEAYE